MMINSPLRYPGGKAKLSPFLGDLIIQNGLVGSEYCEPYAGGAGLAIKLLSLGFVDRIAINDIDPAIYSFWRSALERTSEFCELIDRTPLTIDEWYRQRQVWREGDVSDQLALGFSAFYLNRTNRSGIIDGAGPIGGYSQEGPWKLGVRFIRDKQISNLLNLQKYSSQISISNMDAIDFLSKKLPLDNTFVYADPPYFVKGKKLYRNSYEMEDHCAVCDILSMNRDRKWIVSYDDVPEIRSIYSEFLPTFYQLNYSAGTKNVGNEVIYASDALKLPTMKALSGAA